MEQKDPFKLEDEQLIKHYEEAVIYRNLEQEVGQITPWLMEYKDALEEELLFRIQHQYQTE